MLLITPGRIKVPLMVYIAWIMMVASFDTFPVKIKS